MENSPIATEISPQEVLGWMASQLKKSDSFHGDDRDILIQAVAYDYTLLQALIAWIIDANGGKEYPVEHLPAPRLGVLVAVQRGLPEILAAMAPDPEPPAPVEPAEEDDESPDEESLG
jgi:hypothetical protein